METAAALQQQVVPTQTLVTSMPQQDVTMARASSWMLVETAAALQQQVVLTQMLVTSMPQQDVMTVHASS